MYGRLPELRQVHPAALRRQRDLPAAGRLPEDKGDKKRNCEGIEQLQKPTDTQAESLIRSRSLKKSLHLLPQFFFHPGELVREFHGGL